MSLGGRCPPPRYRPARATAVPRHRFGPATFARADPSRSPSRPSRSRAPCASNRGNARRSAARQQIVLFRTFPFAESTWPTSAADQLAASARSLDGLRGRSDRTAERLDELSDLRDTIHIHGLKIETPRLEQSRSFRVTNTSRWIAAVASKRPSLGGSSLPDARPTAVSLPHSLAMGASIRRNRPTNRRGSSSEIQR